MLRLVELEHELSEPESSLSRPPRRRLIDVTVADAPVDVHWVAFENYYTASVTVLHTNSPPIDPQPRWTCALGQLRLMASAHCEDDAQDRHELHATAFADGFDATRVTRLRVCLVQPSPAWAEHGLRRLKFYTARVATPTAWASRRSPPRRPSTPTISRAAPASSPRSRARSAPRSRRRRGRGRPPR